MGGESIRVDLPLRDPVFAGVRKVVRALRQRGREAYVVGGAVRDLVMGIRPREYDVATSARPEEVQALFRHTIPVGIKFGVVLVRLGGREYEVATYRVDLGYSDGRRPDGVRFADLREDVLRRDFTMNGLALDPETGEVVDLVGGIADIRAGVVRAIGDAAERFAEDRLRPLRAVRFAAQTGFRVEEATWAAAVEAAGEVRHVSMERVRDEVHKTLQTARPGLGLRLMHESGILRAVLPALAEAVGEDAGPLARVLDRLAGRGPEVLWAALAWPLGAEGAGRFARALRHSRRMVEAMRRVAEAGRAIRALPDPDVAVEKRVLRSPHAARAVEVLEAWLAETGGDERCVRHARERLGTWAHGDLFPPHLVGGGEVVAMGIPPGPRVGRALHALEDAQLRGEVADREGAIRFLQGLASGRA